jgi:anti-sigma regulatory factor (Ser/Thr protein kinase)
MAVSMTEQDPTMSAQAGAGALFHEALLYRSGEEYGDAVADFARAAAQADEPILAILPPATRPLVESALQSTDADCHFEDMSDRARNPSCLLQIQRDWVQEHAAPVRMLSEGLWPERRPAEVAEVLRHEALVNLALDDASAKLLCPYDVEHLEVEALQGARLTHPQVIENGHSGASPDYGDPAEVWGGHRWPQAGPAGVVHEVAFTGDLQALRQAVKAEPVADSLGSTRRSDLVFVIHEAASNAIRHGDGNCTVRLWKEGPAVVGEVRSRGTRPDALAGRLRPSNQALGGRGLWLINQLCDLVELRSEENETSLRMHLT